LNRISYTDRQGISQGTLPVGKEATGLLFALFTKPI
jgi:hypothetical protein